MISHCFWEWGGSFAGRFQLSHSWSCGKTGQAWWGAAGPTGCLASLIGVLLEETASHLILEPSTPWGNSSVLASAGAPQQVAQESQEEAPVPPKSPVSLSRLAPLSLGGMAGLWLPWGQAHWCWCDLPIIRVRARETLASLQAHAPDAHGLGRFLRFIGGGGMGPSSGRWMALTGQSRRPMAGHSTTHRAADGGAIWIALWPVSTTVFPRGRGDLLSQQHHHSSHQHLVLSNF